MHTERSHTRAGTPHYALWAVQVQHCALMPYVDAAAEGVVAERLADEERQLAGLGGVDTSWKGRWNDDEGCGGCGTRQHARRALPSARTPLRRAVCKDEWHTSTAARRNPGCLGQH